MRRKKKRGRDGKRRRLKKNEEKEDNVEIKDTLSSAKEFVSLVNNPVSCFSFLAM